MKRATLAALLTLMLIASATAAEKAAAWWNHAFAFRASATVNTLFQKRRDALVKVKVDFAGLMKKAGAAGEFDPSSIRVVAADTGEVVDSQFISQDGVAGRLCWILSGKSPALAERTFHIYFDIAAHGPRPKPKPVKIPGTNVGVNLVKNPGFEEADPKDPRAAAGWELARGASDSVCRTDEQAHSGKYSLKLVTTPKQRVRTGGAQRVPVAAGRKYLVRAWVKCEKFDEGGAGVWAWYQFDNKARHKEFGNYKTSAVGRPSTEWTQVATSRIQVQVMATKEQHRIDGLLPGTVAAIVSPGAYYGTMVVYIDDVEFIELSERKTEPVEVLLGAPESRGN